VDVGTDQLHEKIRIDTRVTSYEQTDIRDFSGETIYDIIVCDASFISLSQILDALLSHACLTTNIILLFKPQFEVGK
jgi:23S rRNA (cytidine1920-2'-O)/16S rRNA (cytidine1409-2'-O)-methyltransferase